MQNLLTKGRESILKYLPQNSCVSSTRFAIEYLGEEWRAIPVYLLATDYVGSQALVGRPPSFLPQNSEWAGHLVACTDDKLLDLSLDQVYNFQFTPALFEIDKNFWDGVPLVSDLFSYRTIVYWWDIKAPDWTHTKAWNELWKEPYREFKDSL